MRFRVFAPLAALLFVIACSGSTLDRHQIVDNAGVAAKRQNAALVVGVSYAAEASWALKNTVADARDVAAKLEDMNYDVTLLIDPLHDDVWDAVFDLSDSSVDPEAGLKLFYFAGHGLQNDGRNFLVTGIDPDGLVRTIGLQDVIAEIGGGPHESLFFFDACRTPPGVSVAANNSFVTTPVSADGDNGDAIAGEEADVDGDGRFGGERSIGLRLREEEAIETAGLGVVLSNIANTFIMYSTAPNQVAFDGVGENSPFAEAFLEHIDEENANLDEIATEIARGTWARTNREQDPWKTTNALTNDIFLRVPRAVKIAG